MKTHEGACLFTKEHFGSTLCDQGVHYANFCITCGCSLPSYIGECYECQESSDRVPSLNETVDNLRRTLVMQHRARKEQK